MRRKLIDGESEDRVGVHGAEALLCALFGKLDAGFITIWTNDDATKRRVTHWFRLSDPEDLSKATQKALSASAAGCDAYFSTCPGRVRGGPSKRISQDQVICVPALFMDCDIGKPNCPATREELMGKLLTLGAPPSVVVGSGGGCHAYWILDKPFDIGDAEALQDAKVVLRGFANGIAQELGFTGFDLSASEPARVLRVPGTFNYKSDPPRPVEVLHFTDIKYTLDDLFSRVPDDPDEGLEEHQPQPGPDLSGYELPGPSASSSSELSDDQVKAKARAGKDGDRFSRLWSGNWSQDYKSQSEGDIALCNMLAFYTNKNEAQMDRLFRDSGLGRRDKWDEVHGSQTYGEMTIRDAIDSTRNGYDPSQKQSTTAAEDFASPTPFDRFRRAYELVGGYSADKGSIWAESKDKNGDVTSKPLANFAALIKQEITRDDGLDLRKEFMLEGITSTGKTLHTSAVPCGKFSGMSWVLEAWGADANLFPGQTVKDKVRYAIQAASAPLMSRSTVYTHTGWRKIGGQWAYLYHGGAVGVEGISVELEGPLKLYALPPAVDDLGQAARASLALLDVLPARIGVPLIAHAYLAPLYHFMEAAGCAPAYVLYLSGASGSRKSTAAALAMAHFGAGFNAKQLPASFNDTANATRQKAFELKDMPLLVDDYAPVMNAIEQRRRSTDAQQLVRAWGDHAERGRMKSDSTLQKARPPRGIGLMTGEEVPDIGESGVARLFVVDLKPDEIPVGPQLTQIQDQAGAGILAQAMRGYIEWLLPQVSDLPARLKAMYQQHRAWAQENLAGVHGRQPEAVAWLLVGYRMALDFWTHAGALEDSAPLWAQACGVFLEHSQTQGLAVQAEDPIRLFMEALNELLATGKARIIHLAGPEGFLSAEDAIGYQDADYVYLLPGTAYGAVCEHYKSQGTIFPIGKSQLWKRMENVCIVKSWQDRGQTKTRNIPGRGSVSLVWIPRVEADRRFKGLEEPEKKNV